MFKNIKNNNVRGLKLKLRHDKYYDFMLYRGECESTYITDDCIVTEITADNEKDGKYISPVIWSGAKNYGVVLEHFGFTGMDNGLIKFDKYKISNADFLKLLTESKYILSEGDNNFFMSPVSGNTYQYSYDYSIETEGDKKYFALNGGFFQGFYKLFDEDYQTLPNHIDDEWNLEFVVRKRNYDNEKRTLNDVHPDNNGIFFYMGLRSENKFWDKYLVKNWDAIHINENDIEIDYSDCETLDYFTSDYYANCEEHNDGYFEKEISLDDVKVTTKDGKDTSKRGYYEIVTDNKFVTFDNTKDGFTTKTFDAENPYVMFEGNNGYKEENLFMLMNHTSSGLTTKTISEHRESNPKQFDVYKDIKNNAFALKINDDGSIGYKYIIGDCDSENGFSLIEQRSKENIVPFGEWVTINVKIKIINSLNDNCKSDIGKRKMKMYFYVNGNLVFVSKELPEFTFRELDEIKEKQEMVPYNISLGGGTQGLAERIWIDFCDIPDYVLPIEKNFAGTFVGDIMSFKFYDCRLDYNSINDNVFNG